MNEENTNTPTPEEQQPIIEQPTSSFVPSTSKLRQKFELLYDECAKVLIDQEDLIKQMMCCILCDGHILLEGVPGIAKTLSARVFSKTIDAQFSRIQFTPDLLPSDILGTSIFNMQKSEFEFKKGPVFSNIVLIDEINRAPAKTQSALFEVMEEKQITNDGVKYDMSYPFMVIATQNPIEQEGTYRLPEAQLDRFLMKIHLDYPSASGELQILKRFRNQLSRIDLEIVSSILAASDIKELQNELSSIHVEDQMLQYITQIIQETRTHRRLVLGASPRASLGILKSAKVIAMLEGRNFLIPDDVQYVAPHILNHRLILTAEAEMENVSTLDVIEEIIQTLEVPR
jgi:MoxR-like ATPase